MTAIDFKHYWLFYLQPSLTKLLKNKLYMDKTNLTSIFVSKGNRVWHTSILNIGEMINSVP